MSGRSFRSVFMVASCAGAALGCYLVSLRVASERAAVEEVESRIVMAQRDIRLLQTEIGTRGRLAQLERWNVRVLALSAPSADQFLEGSFALARLARPEPKPQIEAPVVLASAPIDSKPPLPAGQVASDDGPRADALLHQASLRRASGEPAAALQAGSDETPNPRKSAGADKDNGGDGTIARGTRTAKVDPLAPLPARAGETKRKETGLTR